MTTLQTDKQLKGSPTAGAALAADPQCSTGQHVGDRVAPLEALRSILALLRSSEGSDWAHEEPPEIAAAVEAAIAALQG